MFACKRDYPAKKEDYKALINGNWVSYHNQDYVEVYFDTSSYILKSEISGQKPSKYKIIADSIWFRDNPFKILLENYNLLFLIPSAQDDTLKLYRLNVIDSAHSNLAYSIRKVCYMMNNSIITPDSALNYFNLLQSKDTTIKEETVIINPRN